MWSIRWTNWWTKIWNPHQLFWQRHPWILQKSSIHPRNRQNVAHRSSKFIDFEHYFRSLTATTLGKLNFINSRAGFLSYSHSESRPGLLNSLRSRQLKLLLPFLECLIIENLCHAYYKSIKDIVIEKRRIYEELWTGLQELSARQTKQQGNLDELGFKINNIFLYNPLQIDKKIGLFCDWYSQQGWIG